MKHFIQKINKSIAIIISFLMIAQNVVYATQGFPVQITSAEQIPLSPNPLPSDEAHSHAPPLPPISQELSNAATDLNTVLIDADSQDWNLYSQYSQSSDDPELREIFNNTFMYEYYKAYFNQMAPYYSTQPWFESYKNSYLSYYINQRVQAMKNYNLIAQATTNYALIFQSAVATIDSMVEQAEVTGSEIDMHEYYKLDRKAKIAANIWQVLHDNPNADPVIVAASESTTASRSDSGRSKNNGCNAVVDSKDTIQGSPVYSYNPKTLDIFLEDMPLYYKPSLGPDIKIHLIYSSSRTQTGSVGNKWFINLDSKVIYNPDYTKDDYYGHEDHELIFVSPNGRTDPCDLFELSPIISDDGQTVKPPELWSYGYNSTDDDKPHYLNIFEAQIDENFYGVNSDRQKHLLISFDDNDSIALEARAIQRDGSLLIYKPVSAGSQELLLSEERDKYGNAIFYNRDSNNQIISIIDSCGNETVIGWDLGRIYTITDPENNKVEFTYGYHSFPSRYLISSISDAAGFVSAIEYNSDFVYKLTIDGNETTFYKQSSGSGDNLLNTLTITVNLTDGEGYTDVIQWSSAAYYTRNKNNFWHKYVRNYNVDLLSPNSNRIFSSTDYSTFDYWLYSDTENGASANNDFKLSNITLFNTIVKDSEGNPLFTETSTDPLTGEIVINAVPTSMVKLNLIEEPTPGEYNPNDDNCISLPGVTEKCYFLNSLNQVCEIIDPLDLNKRTKLQYDIFGNVESVKSPDGAEWKYIYNAQNNLTRIVDPSDKNLYKYSYDNNGRITKTEAVLYQIPLQIGNEIEPSYNYIPTDTANPDSIEDAVISTVYFHMPNQILRDFIIQSRIDYNIWSI